MSRSGAFFFHLPNSAFNKKCFDATKEKVIDIGDEEDAVNSIEEIGRIVDVEIVGGRDSWELQILNCNSAGQNQVAFAATLLLMPLNCFYIIFSILITMQYNSLYFHLISACMFWALG